MSITVLIKSVRVCLQALITWPPPMGLWSTLRLLTSRGQQHGSSAERFRTPSTAGRDDAHSTRNLWPKDLFGYTRAHTCTEVIISHVTLWSWVVVQSCARTSIRYDYDTTFINKQWTNVTGILTAGHIYLKKRKQRSQRNQNCGTVSTHRETCVYTVVFV